MKMRNIGNELREGIRAIKRGKGRRYTVKLPKDVRAICEKMRVSRPTFHRRTESFRRKRARSMAKKYSELRARLSPKARAQSEAMAAKLMAEMPLQELRQALDLTQQQVARTLKIEQAAVSKIEKQTDMYLSTLRRFIAAMGGELEIVARFPDGAVRITQFESPDENAPRARGSR
jgi:DNA-binding XRE family transcriptional regulator